MRIGFSGPRIFGIRPWFSFPIGAFRIKPQRPPGPRLTGAFVYVIRGDHNMVKVGVTTNPSARIASLRTGSAFPIDFAFIGATPGSGMDIERRAHQSLARYSCTGEWFDVSPEIAISAVLGAAAKLGRHIVATNESEANMALQIISNYDRGKPEVGWLPFIMFLIAGWAALFYAIVQMTGG